MRRATVNGVVGEQMRLKVSGEEPLLSEPLLTPVDAAALLSVRLSWIYEAVRTGRLPHLRVGRHVRFLRADLERWLREQSVGSAVGARSRS